MVVLTNFEPPTDGIIHRETNSAAFIQGKNQGTGTLFIAESRLSWVGENGQGFSVEYPAISIHAISKDLRAFPHQCLYLILDCDLDAATAPAAELSGGGGDGDDDDGGDEGEEDEESGPTELRFVPQEPGSLEAMYQAMCRAQELHPDEQADSDSDAEWYYGGEDDGAAGGGDDAAGVDGRLPAFHTAGQAALGSRLATTGHGSNGTGDGGGVCDDVMDTGQFEDADASSDEDADQ